MHKFVSELPKMTEADLVASGRQGKLPLVLASRFTPTHATRMHR